MLGHVWHTENESGDQNPGVCIPDVRLASLRKRGIAPCILPPFLWIFISLGLVGRHWSEEGRCHSQESPSLAAAWHSRAKGERCRWITARWSARLDRTAVCLKDKQTSSSYTFKRKQILLCLKNLRIAICLIPELLRCLDVSFPTEISIKYIL